MSDDRFYEPLPTPEEPIDYAALHLREMVRKRVAAYEERYITGKPYYPAESIREPLFPD